MRFSLKKERSTQLLDAFSSLRLAVLGDAMLDRYIRGSAKRLSPEAPVPVVDILEESEHPGGAANVAINLAALGASVELFGAVGNDGAADDLRQLLRDHGIVVDGLVGSNDLRTTVKTRVIADGQHIVRADRESTDPYDEAVNSSLVEMLLDRLDHLDGLILQDYNKGTLTSGVIKRVVDAAREEGVPVFVDPKRDNFYAYSGATIFKPNRAELEMATGETIHLPSDGVRLASQLRERLGCQTVVLTLGAEGMVVDMEGSNPFHVDTRAIQVADVSGAGDTVISLIAIASAAGATPLEAAVLANAGAGIVCGQVGTVAVTTRELRKILSELSSEVARQITTDHREPTA